jgi:hypothetical protein
MKPNQTYMVIVNFKWMALFSVPFESYQFYKFTLPSCVIYESLVFGRSVLLLLFLFLLYLIIICLFPSKFPLLIHLTKIDLNRFMYRSTAAIAGFKPYPLSQFSQWGPQISSELDTAKDTYVLVMYLLHCLP